MKFGKITAASAIEPAAPAIALEDGTAHYMGDGMFVLLQRDDQNRPQSVAVSRRDLEALLAVA
ncbi:hypothetical protein [Novosphingobium sp. UBA1939]|uniref:hypothetical protein n=1 Tax=Novosphingobium sp. UBA1939 TaxID=1946982 RepID=UPI0025E5EC23|nr:hypothetical protein [Novosphingobium sp. UBA1939]